MNFVFGGTLVVPVRNRQREKRITSRLAQGLYGPASGVGGVRLAPDDERGVVGFPLGTLAEGVKDDLAVGELGRDYDADATAVRRGLAISRVDAAGVAQADAPSSMVVGSSSAASRGRN